ncbi:MAG: type IV toxin-antitoxin system AbiEi family antitoxin domain-containing protein [Actinomycetales bacterium]|nr:type IV toxin-antitoxin system AbiEi family antitoxin domain-containing protein [Actinomycetales bacterium]
MIELVVKYLEGNGKGIITTADAAALGVSPAVLRSMLRAGLLVRIARGVYVSAAQFNPPEDSPLRSDRFKLAKHRHLLRLDALLRQYGKKVAASHQSALVVWDLPFNMRALERLHVARTTPGGTLRRFDDFTIHTCSLDDVITLHEERRVVVPSLAVIGQALTVGLLPAVDAADAAIVAGLTTKAELEKMLTRMRHTPQLAVARQAVRLADGLAESPGETRLRLILVELGITFIAQHWVHIEGTTIHYRVDFYLPDLGVILEYDGQVKYGQAAQRRDNVPGEGGTGADAGRTALVNEKAREDDLRREGFGVGRVTSQNLTPHGVKFIVASARQQAQPRALHRPAEPPAWLRQ